MELLTIEEVSAILKLSVFSIREMARNKVLSGSKVQGKWRFLRSDIEDYINKLFNKEDGTLPKSSVKEKPWQLQNEVKPGIHALQRQAVKEYSSLVKPRQKRRHKSTKTL